MGCYGQILSCSHERRPLWPGHSQWERLPLLKKSVAGEKGKMIVAFPGRRLGVECTTEKTAGFVQFHARCQRQCSECGMGTAQLVRGIPGCQKVKELVRYSGMSQSQ